MHRKRLLPLVPLLLVLAGCDGVPESGALSAPPERAEQPSSGFDTAEALLEHIQTLHTADDYFTLLDLVMARTTTEQTTLRMKRDIAIAKRDYHAALVAMAAAEGGGEIPPLHLGMESLHDLIQEAEFTRTDGRKRYATYHDESGAEYAIVVMIWQQSWWVSPDTLAGGAEANEVWYSGRQPGFVGTLRAYRGVLRQIGDGELASLAAAETALADALAAPPPNIGSAHIGNRIPTRTREQPDV